MGSRGASSGATKKRDIVHNGNMTSSGQYANSGYNAIRKLPVGAEFTVQRANPNYDGSTTTRYRIVGTAKNHSIYEIVTKEKPVYITPAAYHSSISSNSSISRIQRIIGSDAEHITIHNGGRKLPQSNRKTVAQLRRERSKK